MAANSVPPHGRGAAPVTTRAMQARPESAHVHAGRLLTLVVLGALGGGCSAAASFTLADLLSQQGSSAVGCLTFPFVDPSLFASSAYSSIDFQLLLATPLALHATVCLPLTAAQASYFSSNSSSAVDPLSIAVYTLPPSFPPAWQTYVAGSPLINASLPLVLLAGNTADEWTLLAHTLASNGYVTVSLPLSAACPPLTIGASGVADSLLSGEVGCVAAVQRLLAFGLDSVQAEMQTTSSPLYTAAPLTSVWRVVHVAAGGLCAVLLSVVQQLAVTSVRSTRVSVSHAGVLCLEAFSMPLSVAYPAFFSPSGSFGPAVVLPAATSFLALSSASSCLSPPAQHVSPLYSLLLTQPSRPACLTSIQSSAAATHPCLFTDAALRAELSGASGSAVDACALEEQCRAEMARKAGTSSWLGAGSAGMLDAVGHRVLLWRLLSGWLSWIAGGGGAGTAWKSWRYVLQNDTASGLLAGFTQNCIVAGTQYNQ